MTEQEIIDFLKKNKEMGIAFAFMPDEVQEWCYTNNGKVIFFHISKINHDGEWADHSDNDVIFEPTDIVALPDSFQMFKEQKDGWIEFNINSSGFFSCAIQGYFGTYHWSEWYKCLSFFSCGKEDFRLTAFGGWQYKEHSEFWYTSPQMLTDVQKGCISSICDGRFNDCKPLIPIKIRFWRESQ